MALFLRSFQMDDYFQLTQTESIVFVFYGLFPSIGRHPKVRTCPLPTRKTETLPPARGSQKLALIKSSFPL
ncbi:Uncharacterized protein APZ42_024239 [Daphnia magna]|uniref:Uncharacterized protein n=1 Tax=Daphnia magna TaxID=35525 RepID=A0A162DGH4_9CRUS|nr:Uncharacterized protein APZ42_024239 [Daphnia magna]